MRTPLEEAAKEPEAAAVGPESLELLRLVMSYPDVASALSNKDWKRVMAYLEAK